MVTRIEGQLGRPNVDLPGGLNEGQNLLAKADVLTWLQYGCHFCNRRLFDSLLALIKIEGIKYNYGSTLESTPLILR